MSFSPDPSVRSVGDPFNPFNSAIIGDERVERLRIETRAKQNHFRRDLKSLLCVNQLHSKSINTLSFLFFNSTHTIQFASHNQFTDFTVTRGDRLHWTIKIASLQKRDELRHLHFHRLPRFQQQLNNNREFGRTFREAPFRSTDESSLTTRKPPGTQSPERGKCEYWRRSRAPPSHLNGAHRRRRRELQVAIPAAASTTSLEFIWWKKNEEATGLQLINYSQLFYNPMRLPPPPTNERTKKQQWKKLREF